MTLIVQAEAPPLREELDGAVRVGESRVLLETVIQAFEDGATPEAIVQRYATLTLSNVYAVVAFYLRHHQEVAEYMAARARRAGEVWERIERSQGDMGTMRARLQAHRKA